MSAHPPLKMQKSFSVVQLGSDGGIRQSIGVRKEGGAGFVPEFPLESNGWQDVRSRAGFTHLDVDVIGLAGFDLRACRSHFTCCPPTSLRAAGYSSLFVSHSVTGCCVLRSTTDERRRQHLSTLLLSKDGNHPARLDLFARASLPKRRLHVTGCLCHCSSYRRLCSLFPSPRPRW